MAERVPPGLPDRVLRKALTLVLGMAQRAAQQAGQQVGQQVGQPGVVEVPAGLRAFGLAHRELRDSELVRLRSLVEDAPEFRAWAGERLPAEAVGEVGHLWLTRPDGWEDAVLALASNVGEPEGEGGKERRRREAAEAKAAQLRLELDTERVTVARLTAEVERLEDQVAEWWRKHDAADRLAGERASTARKGVSERDRAVARAEAAEVEVAALTTRLADAEAARDALLADAAASWAESAEVQRVRSLLAEAHGVLDALVRRPEPRAVRRSPQAVPGNVVGDDVATLAHLLKVAGMRVVIDGYNVAKLGWPALSLVEQRERCVEALEAVASRTGAKIHVIFDGSTVAGASTNARRTVRVSFSPEGTLADDVIRAEVTDLDPSFPVLVVTNDKAVLKSVRSHGANVASSDALVAYARR